MYSYVDPYISLAPNTPAFAGNRSIVVHFANKTRITCANLIPLAAADEMNCTTAANTTTTPANPGGAGAGSNYTSAAPSMLGGYGGTNPGAAGGATSVNASATYTAPVAGTSSMATATATATAMGPAESSGAAGTASSSVAASTGGASTLALDLGALVMAGLAFLL